MSFSYSLQLLLKFFPSSVEGDSSVYICIPKNIFMLVLLANLHKIKFIVNFKFLHEIFQKFISLIERSHKIEILVSWWRGGIIKHDSKNGSKSVINIIVWHWWRTETLILNIKFNISRTYFLLKDLYPKTFWSLFKI